MRIFNFAVLLICLVTLSSCSSLDKQTCQNSNWERVGLKDGRDGRAFRNFSRDELKCSDAGVTIDRESYIKGYARGIAAYCTRINGVYVGSNGEKYEKQCPISLESEFLSGYVIGKREFDRNAHPVRQNDSASVVTDQN